MNEPLTLAALYTATERDNADLRDHCAELAAALRDLYETVETLMEDEAGREAAGESLCAIAEQELARARAALAKVTP